MSICPNKENDSCSLNFSITDGFSVIGSRFIANQKETPPSLYFSTGSRYHSAQNCFVLEQGDHRCVIISSEPINKNKEQWKLVPKNHLITVTKYRRIKISRIKYQ